MSARDFFTYLFIFAYEEFQETFQEELVLLLLLVVLSACLPELHKFDLEQAAAAAEDQKFLS